MDVLTLTGTGSGVPFANRTGGAAGAAKPSLTGNPLPQMGHIDAAPNTLQSDDSHAHMSSEALHGLVDQANEALLVQFSNLKFSVAEGTNINVVQIEDAETGEVIRQIPSETMIALARAWDESRQGTLLAEKA